MSHFFFLVGTALTTQSSPHSAIPRAFTVSALTASMPIIADRSSGGTEGERGERRREGERGRERQREEEKTNKSEDEKVQREKQIRETKREDRETEQLTDSPLFLFLSGGVGTAVGIAIPISPTSAESPSASLRQPTV